MGSKEIRSGVIFLFISICSSMFTVKAQNEISYKLGESEYFEFYSDPWVNMHHFLQFQALRYSRSESLENWFSLLNESDSTTFKKLLDYYSENLLQLDLRTSKYQREFIKIISSEYGTSAPGEEFVLHLKLLDEFFEIYEKHFWANQFEINNKVFSSNRELISRSEKAVISELMNITYEYWPRTKIRVDIVYFGKATSREQKAKSYSTLEPPNIFLSTYLDSEEPMGNWVETLYHEGTHQIVSPYSGFIGGTICDVSGFPFKNPPDQLWHAYIFYMVGWLSENLFPDYGIKNYRMYLRRNDLYTDYLGKMDQFLPNYFNRKTTLFEATISIVQSL